MNKVTKAEALRRFVDERVIGEKGLAMRVGQKYCSYSHQVNGGCAIGILVPGEVAETLDAKQGGMTDTHIKAICQPYLEDVHHGFWIHLQSAHDALANYERMFLQQPGPHSGELTPGSVWAIFEESMLAVVEGL